MTPVSPVQRIFWRSALSAKILQQTLFGRDRQTTIYITLGNPLRGDDGVGPYITRNVSGAGNICIRDAGDRPERALDWAIEFRPDTIIFIDAADFGGVPGEIRCLARRELKERCFSTHRLPLAAVIDWINRETGAECHCLGIQLGSTSPGEELSAPVHRSADKIVEWLSATSP